MSWSRRRYILGSCLSFSFPTIASQKLGIPGKSGGISRGKEKLKAAKTELANVAYLVGDFGKVSYRASLYLKMGCYLAAGTGPTTDAASCFHFLNTSRRPPWFVVL